MKRFFYALCSVVLVMAACATAPRNVAGVQDITGGIGIVVDASAVNKNTIGRDDFSIPDNRAIATLAGNAAADTLARKGYAAAGPVVTSAGARLSARESYAVTDMEGKKFDAPEAIQPPFMVEPPLPDTGRAHIAPLFNSLYAYPGSPLTGGQKELSTVKPEYLDVAEGGGAVLAVICEGHVPSGGSRAAAVLTALFPSGKGEIRTQSTAEIYLIDRRSGATLWHDVMVAHDVSPAFFADAVTKMLEKLPPPRNP